jgi:hypothetical protein
MFYMFREIFDGLMGKPKETPPPLTKGNLGDSEARLQASFGRPTTAGQGFDRGGWEPTAVNTSKAEALPQPEAQGANPAPTRAVKLEPFDDAFSSEPTPQQGVWVDTRRKTYSVPQNVEHPDQDGAAAK